MWPNVDKRHMKRHLLESFGREFSIYFNKNYKKKLPFFLWTAWSWGVSSTTGTNISLSILGFQPIGCTKKDKIHKGKAQGKRLDDTENLSIRFHWKAYILKLHFTFKSVWIKFSVTLTLHIPIISRYTFLSQWKLTHRMIGWSNPVAA